MPSVQASAVLNVGPEKQRRPSPLVHGLGAALGQAGYGAGPSWCREELLNQSPPSMHQFLTSKRRIDDQMPGLPDASLARTRHHIRFVGSVLVLNCETATA